MLLKDVFEEDCKKSEIPVTESLSITQFLTDESEIGEWNLQGLPVDDLSIQNALIVTRATRYPLLIDPQGQGKTWLTNRNIKNQLKTTTLQHKGFRLYLEECLSLICQGQIHIFLIDQIVL